MKIEYLCDRPELVATVVDWIYCEFVVKENGSASLAQVADFFGHTAKKRFPITLVASDHGACVGTVSLVENDLKSQDKLTPWLASLYVYPAYRGRGIAKRLIKEVEDITANLGWAKLYLRTEHAADYYLRLGWIGVGTAIDRGQQTQIFCKAAGEGK